MRRGFIGERGFLSNFDTQPFKMYGRKVKSAEHAFNALKTLHAEKRLWVLSAASPAEAKGHGRRVPLRPGWDEGVRVAVMREVITAKFSPGSDYAERLVATGTEKLVEYNCWHDQFWGDCTCDKEANCFLTGTNMLGEILMSRRATLARNSDAW